MNAKANSFFPKISKMIDSLDNCPLKNIGILPVHPAGSGINNLMLIGEPPEAKEEESRRPMSGRIGKILDQIFFTPLKIEKDETYLTNIIKCRPPSDREPNTKEKAAWKGVLIQEIKAVNPKVIVTLGKHSLSFFMPKPKISQLHGKVINLELKSGQSIILIPMYNPAVALHRESMKTVLIKDFAKIPQYLR